MFAEIYLHTTNPELSFSEIFRGKWILLILMSILCHAIVYLAFINCVHYIFLNKVLDNNKNINIFCILFAVMVAGYVGRVLNVQNIYRAYNKDAKKTREHCDKVYLTPIFIA